MEYATQAHLTANSHIGTTLPEDKPEHAFRLFCINPNGVCITSQKKSSLNYPRLCQHFKWTHFAHPNTALTQNNIV